MSTYLELCADLRSETTDSGTGPSAVTGNTGELARVVKWIKDAWVDLQQEKDDWFWMRKSFTVSAISNDGEYAYSDCTDTVSLAAISRFSHWYKHSFKCYLTSAGVGAECPLRWLPWEDFRAIYRYGTQTNSAPEHVSQDPTGKFVLGPKPDATYTVSGDYQIGPQILVANADEPEMPSRFHRLIVCEAMTRYAGHRVAPEVMARAVTEGGRLRSALGRDQLPEITRGRSIA